PEPLLEINCSRHHSRYSQFDASIIGEPDANTALRACTVGRGPPSPPGQSCAVHVALNVAQSLPDMASLKIPGTRSRRALRKQPLEHLAWRDLRQTSRKCATTTVENRARFTRFWGHASVQTT